MIPISSVDVRSRLSAAEFNAEYVGRKPVLVRGALAHLPAVSRWSLDYFASLAPDLPVCGTVRLADYCRAVADWERRAASSDDPPAPLHDLRLLSLIPGLRRDLTPFPAELLPQFLRDQGWVFPRFSVGPSQAEDPLRFDTLPTHNLFCQFHGATRFVMIDAADRHRCRTWRWSPERVDRFPRIGAVRARLAIVAAGDLLYLPPGTPHAVVSLSPSVSFHIDWRVPSRNLRHNLLVSLGVLGGVPLPLMAGR